MATPRSSVLVVMVTLEGRYLGLALPRLPPRALAQASKALYLCFAFFVLPSKYICRLVADIGSEDDVHWA
jgi:hypothetical protein